MHFLISSPPYDNLPFLLSLDITFFTFPLVDRHDLYNLSKTEHRNNPTISSRAQIYLETFKCLWNTLYSLEAESTQAYDTSMAKNEMMVCKDLLFHIL